MKSGGHVTAKQGRSAYSAGQDADNKAVVQTRPNSDSALIGLARAFAASPAAPGPSWLRFLPAHFADEVDGELWIHAYWNRGPLT